MTEAVRDDSWKESWRSLKDRHLELLKRREEASPDEIKSLMDDIQAFLDDPEASSFAKATFKRPLAFWTAFRKQLVAAQ